MHKPAAIPLHSRAIAAHSTVPRHVGLAYCAIFTTLATYGLIVLGGTVRATDSGTACPDWPLCHGAVVPRVEYHVLIEWSHRMVASIVGVLIFGFVVWAWRSYSGDGFVKSIAGAAIMLLITQVLVGAVTVNTETDASIVALHLSIALTLFSSLIVLAVRVTRRPRARNTPAAPAWLALATMVALFALIIVGAYVSQEGAGLVYPDWPLFDGKLVSAGGKLADLHYAHRLIAAVVGVLLIMLAHSSVKRRQDAAVVAAMGVAGILYVTQVLVGASNIWFDLATSVRIAHLALASALWGVLVFSVAWTSLSPISADAAVR